ncbi:hypothetical protein GGF46_003485 [Coemansia sp. RSA 552]|nr:hypothetical protein GGF46_003485 [Coemansia sp. RSA 552]
MPAQSFLGVRLLAVAAAAICALTGVLGSDESSSVVDLTDYPSVLYVITPYDVCYGALVNDATVITDARCLHLFSKDDGAPDEVSGTLDPKYLLVAVPTKDLSSQMHTVQLSTQPFDQINVAAARANTFFGLGTEMVDNSTFYGVDTSAVHAYFPQSEYDEPSKQKFDVGIVTLKHPIDNAELALLFIDDLEPRTAGLTALTLPSVASTNDPAVQQTLYMGMDLTKAQKIDVTPLDRKECDSDFGSIYDMDDFIGHSLPQKGSPVFCSSIYDGLSNCTADTSMPAAPKNAESTRLNSTLYFYDSGSTIKVVSIAFPDLVENRDGDSVPCSSNGFVHFPRTGMYTDWLGYASSGSFAPNGSWTNKVLTGDIIEDFAQGGGATTLLGPHTVAATLAATALAALSALL